MCNLDIVYAFVSQCMVQYMLLKYHLHVQREISASTTAHLMTRHDGMAQGYMQFIATLCDLRVCSAGVHCGLVQHRPKAEGI